MLVQYLKLHIEEDVVVVKGRNMKQKPTLIQNFQLNVDMHKF